MKNYTNMLREIDLEKNDLDTIRDVLNFVADKIDKEYDEIPSFEDYLKPEIEMWIDNFTDDVDNEDYTIEELDALDIDDIATTVADNEAIVEAIDEAIRDAMWREILGNR